MIIKECITLLIPLKKIKWCEDVVVVEAVVEVAVEAKAVIAHFLVHIIQEVAHTHLILVEAIAHHQEADLDHHLAAVVVQ